MIFRNIGYRFITQTVIYVLYLLVTFIFMVNCLTFWFNFAFVTIAYALTLFSYIGIGKITTLAFLPKMDKIFRVYFIGQLAFAIVLYITMAIIHFSGNEVPAWLGLFHLVQIPVTIIVAMLIARLKIMNKFIGNQIKEEKQTVVHQRRVASSINMMAARSYDFKIKDKLNTLSSKCRGIGLTSNPNAMAIEEDIMNNIDLLNQMLEENASPAEVLSQIARLESLLQYRREANRSY